MDFNTGPLYLIVVREQFPVVSGPLDLSYNGKYVRRRAIFPGVLGLSNIMGLSIS